MLAAHQITTHNLINSFLAFIAFCLIASSVYIVNDLLDLNADRVHPDKSLRPFASGAMPIKNGLVIFSTLFLAGVMLSFFIGFYFLALIFVYYILTFAYSIILKNKVIVDIFILGIFYTLRIIAGGFATGIQISFWLLGFSLFFFLSLAAVKRQSELVNLKNKKKLKIIGRGYRVSDLSMVSMITLSSGFISILVAGFYINSLSAITLYSQLWTLGGTCLVLLFWLIKIIFASSRGLIYGDPIIYAIKDINSRLCFIVIILLFMINFI